MSMQPQNSNTTIALENGRFALPQGFASCGDRLVVTFSPSRSLLLFLAGQWPPIRNKLLGMSGGSESRSHLLRRLLVESATDIEVSQQGTIAIAPEMLRYAGIQDEVLWAPARQGAELWNPSTFTEDWRSIFFLQ